MQQGMEGAVCANIGPREREKRMRIARVMGAVSAGAAVMLLRSRAPRVFRLGLFLPLSVAAIGYFQAKHHTCVALAARGQRNMDEGEEWIEEEETREALKRQGRQVLARSLTTAAALTALAYLLPAKR